MEKYIECGKITNTHGVKGTVRVQSWCDSLDVLLALTKIYINPPTYTEIKILSATELKGVALLSLDGYDCIDTASKLKNTTIYADRVDIPRDEGEFFIADMLGLPVIDADTGATYGELSDVLTDTAQDVYVVKTDSGLKYLPAVPAFVQKIDLKSGIFVTPISGIFDE